MIFYINLNIWKFYYKNNWNFLSFKQSLIKQNFQFLIPLFLKTIDRTWNETKSKKDSKRKKIVRKSKDPLQPRLKNHETRDTSRHVSCEVWRKMWPWSFLRRQRRRRWKEREREKKEKKRKKNTDHSPVNFYENGRPVFASEPWRIREATRALTHTSPRWHFWECGCQKSPQKYKEKERRRLSLFSSVVGPRLSEEALSCHESPFSFRLTNPLKLATRERSMLGQSTNRYL